MDETTAKRPGWLRRRPKTTLALLALAIVAVSLALAEALLRLIFGLGNPVLYELYPLYGYRLRPNQDLKRFFGARIRINNLGLRADEDWDGRLDDKVLFLGDSVMYAGSFIANHELFTTLALKDLPGFKSGNAGVNAWGVENIHGLVVESGFQPAKTYVTVVIENDFYRGFSRIAGCPYWCRKPRLALQEVLYFACFKLNMGRYTRWEQETSAESLERVVDRAARKLKEMDDLLKARGFRHLVYVSPIRDQVVEGRGKDETVARALEKCGVRAEYLLDRIRAMNLAESERRALFLDHFHLRSKGHALWGAMLNEDLKKLLAREG